MDGNFSRYTTSHLIWLTKDRALLDLLVYVDMFHTIDVLYENTKVDNESVY